VTVSNGRLPGCEDANDWWLRQHHMPEAAGEAIDVRYDLVAVGNGELSAGTEVVLDIDNQ
jgi:hypothetical protein